MKMKKNSGFTLIEILASIAIIALLFGIGIPTYNVISKNIKQKSYESKVSYVEIAASKYGSDTSNMMVFVDTLIKEGYLEADDEAGNYLDPRDNSLLNCNLVNIYYDSGQVYSKMSEEKAILEDGKTCDTNRITQESAYLHLSLHEAKNSTGTQWDTAKELNPKEWTKSDVVLIASVPEDVEANVVKIRFNGPGVQEERKITNNFQDQNKLFIQATQILDTTYTVTIEVKYANADGEEKINVYTSAIKVRIDKQAPIVYKDDIKIEKADEWTNYEKTVKVLSSDQSGSGVYGYQILDHATTCSTDKTKYMTSGFDESGYFFTKRFKGTYYVCIIDNAGNPSSNVPFTVRKTDIENPTIDHFTESGTTYANPQYYKNLDITVHAKDENTNDESGISYINYCISYNGSDCNPNGTNSLLVKNGTVTYKMLDNDKRQKICAIAMDQAGNQSDIKCDGAYWVKSNINLSDACIMCDASNNYCDRGIYVKYGNYTFTLFKDAASTNSCYGYTNVGNMPIIDTFCCDQGVCHSDKVYNLDVGIYKNLSKKFNTLPSTSETYTNEVSYPFGTVKSSDVQKNNVPAITVDNRHSIHTFSLASFPDVINDGYSYGLPSENLENVICTVRNTQLTEIDLTELGRNLDINVGEKDTVTCQRPNGTETIVDEITGETKTITKYDTISKTFTVAENPDFDEDHSQIGSASGTDLHITGYISYKPGSISYKKSHYGMLDIIEYQAIRNKDYASDLQTLLSTVVDAVIYSPSSSGNWNASFGHDGTNSDISALYVTKSGYQAVTPMQYGARNTVMTVPFNKTVKVVSGLGYSDDPLIIG